MNQVNTDTDRKSTFAGLRAKLLDYGLLIKFKLSLLVVFSAVVSYLYASPSLDWVKFFWLIIGGMFVTGASNTLNQVLEKDFDVLMNRTLNRPLPAKRMEVSEAVLFAGLLSVAGVLIFLINFNPLASILSALSLISYAFIYTPLKRVSPIAVWVGAIPGALPVLIGWVCATGELVPEAWVLFSLQFFWQFPHFWAIYWVSYDDYSRAGFNLLPSDGGRDKGTAAQCVVYAMVIFLVIATGVWLNMFVFTAVFMVLLNAAYTYFALMLHKKPIHENAKKLMFFSFAFLPLVQILIILSKFL